MDKLYLNVGAGGVEIEGCISVDLEPATKPDVVADVCKLPYEDEVVDGIIAHHVLEHLPRASWSKAVGEWRRVLRMGGKLLIGVPNLENVMRYFLENKYGNRDYWYQCIYGRDLYPTDRHLSGFTEMTLTELLFEYGFGKLEWRDRNESLLVLAVKQELLPRPKENDYEL